MTDRIEKTIELRAPLDRVWRAVTDHEQFGAWFRVALEAPFKVGELAQGRILHPGYEHVIWRARVAAIEPQHRFVFTWHPYAVDPDTDYESEPPTLVEFLLQPVAGGVRLTIVESGFDALPPHRRPDALRMNDQGWTQQVENIRAHVEA